MRVVLWWPGVDTSVNDVARGIGAGLVANGVEVVPFFTAVHLEAAHGVLMAAWRRAKKNGADTPKPTPVDLYYYANYGVLERVARYQPDWVVMVSGFMQHWNYIPYLQRMGARVAFVCTESPYDLASEVLIGQLADHVFTNERSITRVFEGLKPGRVTYLPHAWHPELHRPTGPAPEGTPAHDVVFVGTGFDERVDWLDAMDWTGLDFGLYGTWPTRMRRLPVYSHWKGGNQPNAHVAALYRAAAVGLNLHRTSVRWGRKQGQVRYAESLNPRAYELAACGTFYVSDWRAEVDDVFQGDLPTAQTPAAMAALVQRAVREPSWRADVAARCRERVAAHSWTQRAAGMVAALEGSRVARAA